MKKITAIILSITLLLLLGISAFAGDEDVNSIQTYEFGTLTGTQTNAGKIAGRKIIGFNTKIDKLSVYDNDTKLYATVEVVLRSTGETIGGDRAEVTTNKLRTGYSWECHTYTGNNNPVTSYGAHEVRGYNAYVVYTELVGV